MEYNLLGNTGLLVSRLGFGASALGGVFGKTDGVDGIDAVHAALDSGINYFDVAPAYGATMAESLLGKALKGIPRQSYFLSTKVGKQTVPGCYGEDILDFSASGIRSSLDESSRRLGTDYFDIVHLHDFEYQGRRHAVQAMTEGVETLLRLKEEGRVGNVGCGIYPMDLWHHVFETLPLAAALVHNHYTLNDTSALELIPVARRRGIGIINASPFASGLLTERGAPTWHPAPRGDRQFFLQASGWCRQRGVSISKLAFQFSSQNPDFPTTLFSCSRRTSVVTNLAWHEEPYDEELLAGVRSILGSVINKQWDYDVGSAQTPATGLKETLLPT
jgi:aryl-alcohol dehydrogenase-like predicted oxidoreductase